LEILDIPFAANFSFCV